MRKAISIMALSICSVAFAQDKPAAPPQAPPPPPPAKMLSVNDSASETALVGLSKQFAEAQKDYTDKLSAARAELDKRNKSLKDKLKPIQDDMDKNTTEAENKWKADSAVINQKLGTLAAQINGIIPIVKTEQKLPDNANFDPLKQQWSVPVAAPVTPPAAKK